MPNTDDATKNAHKERGSQEVTPAKGTETPGGAPTSETPTANGADPEESTQEEAETFPRSYVEKLRRESATYRTRAAQADALADALWTARVAASGALADPTDLPRPEDADALDPEAVTSAVSELLERKPHLAARVPRGNVGQGFSKAAEPVSLLGMLRGNAG